MRPTLLILTSWLSVVFGQQTVQPANIFADPICLSIARNISVASAVFYPGQIYYTKGISHWASSSSQLARCVVEPGTLADVGKILRILGSTRTPFAVKGGGHTTNSGFSSTSGVQIAMYRFSEITYNATEQTVIVGAGLIWDDVYAALAPHGVNVVGGRVSGVGVAGFTLGGGYSWKTNQYGLTIDTVTAFELVKSDGTVLYVTESTQPDLFFGLKGGFNNFGIVTRFTLKAFPQGDVWGGLITVTAPFIDQVSSATAEFFANIKDPKASIITTYNFLLGQPGVSQLLFYDGPAPPPGIFDSFLKIPYFTRDVGTRDFLSLVLAGPANITSDQRAIFHTVSVLNYTSSLLKAVVNETIFWGEKLTNLRDFLSGTVPPDYSPFNLYYAWLFKDKDAVFHDAIRQSAARLHAVAVANGQAIDDAPLYPNYAMSGTPLERLYGNNLPRLKALKKIHDPDNVMGLAGGFKF